MKSSHKQASLELPLTLRLAALGLFLVLTVLCGSAMSFPEKATASITSIDANSGVIFAKDSASGQVFQFKLTSLSSLAAIDGAHPLQCSGGACTCNSAADCPAGLACDPNTHACTQACTAASCNGGCCHNGLCAPGTSNNACGAGGGVCAVCGGNTPTCTSTIGGGVCAASGQGPQAGSAKKLNANLGEPCQITSINTASGVVTAKVIDGGTTTASFRFFVRDSALLNSLKEGQAIFADFKTQEVFTSAGANGQGVRLGGILGGSYGNTSFGPVNGARPAGPVDGARPVGPIDGAKPLGPVDGARPLGPIDGAKPIGPVDGARPLGPIDGAKPLGPVDGAHPASSIDGGVTQCTITSIDSSRGFITARDNQTGRAFQFRPSNASFFQSLKPGQAVFANFAQSRVSLMLNGANPTTIGSIVSSGATTHK